MRERLVSVIIPTYGKPDKLIRAVDSVKKQSYTNIEIIVVDDNDPDSAYRIETENIIQTFPDIIYIKHNTNKNGAAARNTGIREAKGEYICFLDADDFYFKDRVLKSVTFLNNNPEYFGVIVDCAFLGNGTINSISKLEELSSKDLIDIFKRKDQIATGSNIFIRFDRGVKKYLFDEKFLRFQDIEFIIRVLKDQKIGVVNEILICKDCSSSSNPNIRKVIDAFELFNTKFHEIYSKMSDEEKMDYMNGALNTNLSILLSNQKFSDAVWYMNEVLPYKKWSIRNKLYFILYPLYKCCQKFKKMMRGNKRTPGLYYEIEEIEKILK